MPQQFHTIVIGAGISGLCTAHRIAQSLGNDAVLVLEANDAPGGYCRSEAIDGFVCDCGPNGFLDKEPRMLDWIEGLDLSGDLVRANEASARRFLLLKDRLVEIQPPPRFFLQPVLSLRGKLRLMMEPLIAARRDGQPESVHAFAARRIGREAADTLASAMVLGVFGGDAKKLSLAHCFPIMAEMEREHGSLLRAMLRPRSGGEATGPRGTLTTLRGGIGRLTDRAATLLGESVRTTSPVRRITKAAGYRVETVTGGAFEAKNLVLAVPSSRAAEIAWGLEDEGLSRNLAAIPHAPIAVVCTGYAREKVSHDVDGFGFLIPPNQRKRALGCIWTSSVFEGYAPDGTVFLRTMIGGAMDPDAVRLSDTELLDVIRQDVHPALRISSEPDFVKIYRHRTGIPQYPLNHGDILANLEHALQRFPGLHLAGNAYRGVSLNDCVVNACAVADEILAAS